MTRIPNRTWAPLGATLILLSGPRLAAAPAQPAPAGSAYAQAEEAYRLQQKGDLDGALAMAEAALRLAPGDRDLRLLRIDLLLGRKRYPEALAALEPFKDEAGCAVQSQLGYALLGAGRPADARPAFRAALAAAATPEERRGALSGLLDAARQADDAKGELDALRGLRALAPGDPGLAKEEGYALDRAGRSAEALAAFRAALRPDSPPEDYLDAAYCARKLGRDAEARDLFAAAVQAQTPEHRLDPATLFGVRREVEGLSRTWGASLSTSYNQGGLVQGASTSEKVVQQGFELYYQPRCLARDGRLVQLFVQGFETVYAPKGWSTGGPTFQPSAGVRVKPFGSQNLVLGVQRVFRATAGAPADWLSTAGYSADLGTDLKGGAGAWNYATLYTEGAWFQSAQHYVHTLEARAGRSWRLGGGNTVLTPHLVAAGDYDNKQTPEPSAGAGAGLALRSWFRQTPAMAPASWVELSVQYREKLSTASRGGGWFARLSCWF
jgi:tetratricopeptide (TPR) repeat protein